MTCREVKRLLPEIVDDALDRERRATLAEHLRSCAACGELVRQFEDSLALFVAHQPSIEAPALEKLWPRVRSQALERTGSHGRLWATALIPSLAGAAALVVLALVLWPSRSERGASDGSIASRTPGGITHVSDAGPGAAAAEATELSGEGGDTASADAPAISRGRPALLPAATTHDAIARATPPATRRPVRRTPPPLRPAAESAEEVLAATPPLTQPSETHTYALVVAEWTVREYDQVLTTGEVGTTSDDAAAEPVVTRLYAVVAKSYVVRSTTRVFDAVAEITDTDGGLPAEPALEGTTDTSDAGDFGSASVHTL